MKNIFFIIPDLSGGGAERVIIQVLKYLDRKKFILHLVLFEKRGAFVMDLPADVKLYALSKGGYLYGLQGLLVLIKLANLIKTKEPEIIVSFMWYTNAISLLARILCGFESKVIVSERYTFSFSYEGWFTETLRKTAVRFFYHSADAIIVVSKKIRQELELYFNVNVNKIVPVYNPIDIERLVQCSQEEVEHKWFEEKSPIIISIGRLTPQKGFSYLIKAIAALVKSGVCCRLVILGDGPEKEILRKLAEKLKIGNKVAFLGFQSNPYSYLGNSTIFVLSSLYEGFPNVLIEAMALGVPCISTRCPTGPDEIITDGVDGILVPPADEIGLTNAIKQLLIDEELRNRLGKAGKRRVADFEVERIVKQYEDVIEDVCAESVEK